VRLQKILASAGIASRRHCEQLLRDGRVTVNGRTAKLGESADPLSDSIALDGRPVATEPLAYWIAHKPVDVVTTVFDPQGRRTVLDLLPETSRRLYPVGRLDRDTEGLMLLTNDGLVAHALLHPSHGSEREYRVTVRGRIARGTLGSLERGIVLDGRRTAPARVGRPRVDVRRGTTTFGLVVTEGRKRQIRRSMSALGHPVQRLVRIRMGPLRLGRLQCGHARPLRSEEVRRLRELVDRLESPRTSSS
jgi:23S rRNA pseudouridine2605 synthase